LVVAQDGAHIAALEILAVEPPGALGDAGAGHHGLAQRVAAVDARVAVDPDAKGPAVSAFEAPFRAEAADQAIVLLQFARRLGLTVPLQITRSSHRDLRSTGQQPGGEA